MIVRCILVCLWGAFTAQHQYRLFGNSSVGHFYLKARVGTPPQSQKLVLNTNVPKVVLLCADWLQRLTVPSSLFFDRQQSTSYKPLNQDTAAVNSIECNSLTTNNTCAFTERASDDLLFQGELGEDQFEMLGVPEESSGERLLLAFGCDTTDASLNDQPLKRPTFGLSMIDAGGSFFANLFGQSQGPQTNSSLFVKLCISNNGGVLGFEDQLANPQGRAFEAVQTDAVSKRGYLNLRRIKVG